MFARRVLAVALVAAVLVAGASAKAQAKAPKPHHLQPPAGHHVPKIAKHHDMNGFMQPHYYDQRLDGLAPQYAPTPQPQLRHASAPLVAPAMRFMQMQQPMPTMAPRFMQAMAMAAPATPNWSGVQGPNYSLKTGPGMALTATPGNYYPPVMPYRFPAAPYDNPTFSTFPSMVMMPVPAPYRSDPLNRLSDGGNYQQNMQHFDHFSTNGVNAGAAGSF